MSAPNLSNEQSKDITAILNTLKTMLDMLHGQNNESASFRHMVESKFAIVENKFVEMENENHRFQGEVMKEFQRVGESFHKVDEAFHVVTEVLSHINKGMSDHKEQTRVCCEEVRQVKETVQNIESLCDKRFNSFS